MTEIKGPEVDAAQQPRRLESSEADPALEALTALSQVAEKSAAGLTEVTEDLASMEEHRREGWTWQRIVTSTPQLLPTMAGIVKDLGRASGEFRRSIAHALRNEGMNVTEVAGLLEVTRQRIGALLRPRQPVNHEHEHEHDEP